MIHQLLTNHYQNHCYYQFDHPNINLAYNTIYIIMKWLILLTTLLLVNCQDSGDWVDPFALPISFGVHPFYAGYLDIDEGKSIYYVYTPSENNPSKDPLVVLLSPGPGCSVLHSWLYSKSEFVFVRNTSNFRTNTNHWSRIANVLYLQGPAGVGFSTGATANISDNTTQHQYFLALFRFYQKFPELKDQNMYLSGYGYAGVTVPKLALNIIQHNRNPDTPAWLRMKLNGTLLFNPCTRAQECDSTFQFNGYTVQALRNSFYITKQLLQSYKGNCTLRLSGCSTVQQKIQSNFRLTGADLHNLYSQCLQQPGDQDCIDHIGIDAFLNDKGVKEDMNVSPKVEAWQRCNASLAKAYVRDDEGSYTTYLRLLGEEQNLKIWIVSGTQSAKVPTYGTKLWIDDLKLTLGLPSIRLWEPWFYQNINAGDIEQMRGLSFITIRSAGFYMFEDQPELADYVYSSFLQGKSL